MTSAPPRETHSKVCVCPARYSTNFPGAARAAAPPADERRLTQLREFAREHLHGGCRILSMRDACPCNLCAVDDLADALARQRQEIAEKDAEIRERDDQFAWLAAWCRDSFGIDSNAVIGSDGWPRKLVEVVAKAASAELDRYREALREPAIREIGSEPEGSVAYQCDLCDETWVDLAAPTGRDE